MELMKNRLIKQIEENFTDYKRKILDNIQEYSYRKRRYGVDFTITLYISSKKIDLDIVKNYIRDTDKLIQLASNVIAVVFDFADEERGLKASENLLSLLEPRLFDEEIFISIVNSHDNFDEKEQVRHLLDLLIESIQNGYNDVPELPS